MSDRPTAPEHDLTWPTLLAHWTAFAQSSLALPKSAEGDRWRSAVPSIINLQAVTFALGDLDRLSGEGEGDRALALDKAEIVIRSATGQLHSLWREGNLPQELAALIHDAGLALSAVRGVGYEWRVAGERLVVDHPEDLIARLIQLNFTGDLYVPSPGVPLFLGSPAAFVGLPSGERPDEHVVRAVKEFLVDVGRPERVAAFRQVLRQFDFSKGGPLRDVVVVGASVGHGSTIGGQPLLVPAIRGGEPQPVNLPPRKSAEISPLPLVFQDVRTD